MRVRIASWSRSTLLVLLLGASVASAAPRVEGIRAAVWDDRYRVVMDLSGEAAYHERVLVEPDRIAIDIAAPAAPDLGLPASSDGLVLGIRCNRLQGPVTQVVLDLARAPRYRIFTLPAEQGRSYRIVCDVLRAPPDVEPPRPRDWVVILDPGHGGRDPGVVNRQAGLEEKEIVLDVARRLKSVLEAEPGMVVRMTREVDQGLRLADRVRAAEEGHGDVFLSIHVNGCPSQSARGAEVFFLSLKGATSAEAEAVADLENAAHEADLPVPNEIARLPFGGDLIQNATHQRSSRLAEVLLDQLDSSNLAATRGVKQANFVVLRSYRIPSALVELGFISNPADARKLASAAHRQALAETIAMGLRTFREQLIHAAEPAGR